MKADKQLQLEKKRLEMILISYRTGWKGIEEGWRGLNQFYAAANSP